MDLPLHLQLLVLLSFTSIYTPPPPRQKLFLVVRLFTGSLAGLISVRVERAGRQLGVGSSRGTEQKGKKTERELIDMDNSAVISGLEKDGWRS